MKGKERTAPAYGKKTKPAKPSKSAWKVTDNRQCTKCGTYDAKSKNR